MIKCVGATKDTIEKIKVHRADFDLFNGLSWLHSLREMQHYCNGAGKHPRFAGWVRAEMKKMPAPEAHGLGAYQSREGSVRSMI